MSIGPLHDPVTWYKIIYTGEQVAQWDFQNNAPAFVLEVPLCNLLTSIYNFVPCDRIVQRAYMLCTSQLQNRPSPPREIPGHFTRVKLRTVGNLTQNEARPVGHLTFVSKRLSAVGKDFAILDTFTGHCSCRFHMGLSVFVILYSYILEYAFA